MPLPAQGASDETDTIWSGSPPCQVALVAGLLCNIETCTPSPWLISVLGGGGAEQEEFIRKYRQFPNG